MTDPPIRCQYRLLLLLVLLVPLLRRRHPGSVNAVRGAGCNGGSGPAVTESALLDEVAHHLAQGTAAPRPAVSRLSRVDLVLRQHPQAPPNGD